MARPCKSVSVFNGVLSKEEKQARLEQEEKLKGNNDKLIPPLHLSTSQQEIFISIVEELQESNILSNLDIHILSSCCRAIDRLNHIESMIDEDITLLSDNKLMSAKDKYTKDLYRCCSELCLSPQSRAKIANINVNTKNAEEDAVVKALRGE